MEKVKFNYDTALVNENLESVLEMGTLSLFQEAKEWYPKARFFAEHLGKIYDKNIYVTSGLIAVLSPQKSWFENIRITEDFLRSNGKRAAHVGTQTKKAVYIYRISSNYVAEIEKALGGLKTTNFFHNIFEPSNGDYVTIDSHMIQIMTGNTNLKSVTPKQYEFLKKELIIFAKKNKLVPSEMQSLLWLVYRKNKWSKV